jgi:hypothetical protein
LIVALLGARAYLSSHKSSPSHRTIIQDKRQEELIFLIVPMVIFLGAFMASTINIGLRYLLPIYPFLYVLASRIAAPWPMVSNARIPNYAAVLSVLVALPGSLLIHPHYVSYFNELIGPSNGYKYLAESNVDWGQDLLQLKDYLDKAQVEAVYIAITGTIQPVDVGIQAHPIPSDHPPTDHNYLVAISINEYLDKTMRLPDGKYAWLRNETPVHRIGYSILIFDLANFY